MGINVFGVCAMFVAIVTKVRLFFLFRGVLIKVKCTTKKEARLPLDILPETS